MSTASTNKKIISTREAADILGLDDSTLRKWRRQGKGPRVIDYGDNCYRYRRSEVERYRDESERDPDE